MLTRTRIYFLAAAFLVIGAFSLYVRLSDRAPEVIKNDLLCPVCGKELPHKGARCPWCDAKKLREELEAKARGEVGKSESNSNNALRVVAAVGIFLGLIAVAFWPQLRKLLQPTEEKGEYLDFRCPKCKRKLRYLASKAGTPGMCPTCKALCMFPHP